MNHINNLIDKLKTPKNRSEITYQVYLKSKIENVNLKNESMCRKCLTSWSLGQFKMKTIPSSHQRRRRRQNLIENLQKTLKSASKDKSTKEIKKLQRKIDHHQDLNNHVMVYKCEICQSSTSFRAWKPKLSQQQKREDEVSSSSGQQKSTQKTTEMTNVATSKKKKKKDKTAGLIIPQQKITTSAANHRQHKNLSMTKLSNLLQQQSTATSKLNQFLK